MGHKIPFIFCKVETKLSFHFQIGRVLWSPTEFCFVEFFSLSQEIKISHNRKVEHMRFWPLFRFVHFEIEINWKVMNCVCWISTLFVHWPQHRKVFHTSSNMIKWISFRSKLTQSGRMARVLFHVSCRLYVSCRLFVNAFRCVFCVLTNSITIWPFFDFKHADRPCSSLAVEKPAKKRKKVSVFLHSLRKKYYPFGSCARHTSAITGLVLFLYVSRKRGVTKQCGTNT